MEGEAAGEGEAAPALAGGVQLGSLFWTGVTGARAEAEAEAGLGHGDEVGLEVTFGVPLEPSLPRMADREEDRPGVAGVTASGCCSCGGLAPTFSRTGLLFWNMLGHLGSPASLLWSARGF